MTRIGSQYASALKSLALAAALLGGAQAWAQLPAGIPTTLSTGAMEFTCNYKVTGIAVVERSSYRLIQLPLGNRYICSFKCKAVYGPGTKTVKSDCPANKQPHAADESCEKWDGIVFHSDDVGTYADPFNTTAANPCDQPDILSLQQEKCNGAYTPGEFDGSYRRYSVCY